MVVDLESQSLIFQLSRTMNMELANTLQGILPMDDEFFLENGNTKDDTKNRQETSSKVCCASSSYPNTAFVSFVVAELFN